MARETTVKPMKNDASTNESPATEAKPKAKASEAKKAAPKSTAAEAKKPAAQLAAPPRATATSSGPAYSLQVGNTFTLLTAQVEGGAVTAQEPLEAGTRLEVSYWKEPQQLSLTDTQFVALKLHARLDGVELKGLELGHTDAAGRFVRTPARVELPATAQQLEYWFEISTSSGQTLWDSNWGNNYRLSLAAPS
jgi:hypothetical protein